MELAGTLLSDTSPLASGWDVYLQVALNGQQYSPVGQVFKFFAQPVSIRSVYPPLGPKTGGTNVTVRGETWVDTGAVFCQIYKLEVTTLGTFQMSNGVNGPLLASELPLFRERGWVNEFYTWMPTELIDETSGTSITPTWQVSEEVQLFISLNKQDLSDNSTKFEYYDDPTVAVVYPDSAPATGVYASGAPLTIIVLLSPFFPLCEESIASSARQWMLCPTVRRNEDLLRCSFGSEYSVGTFINGSAMSCPLSAAPTAGDFPVKVSLNGQQFRKYTRRIPTTA